jgi:hypothetical protein
MINVDNPKAGKKKTGAAKKKAVAAKAPQKTAPQHPPVPVTPEFVEDLKAVFAKHNWSGHPVGFVAHPALAALGAQPCDPGPATCPDGSPPQQQLVNCPDGTITFRNFCP